MEISQIMDLENREINVIETIRNDNTTDVTGSLSTHIKSCKYNLKDAVKLPPREDPREWIAYNTYYFNKQICMLFGTINESCTVETCPKMMIGKKYIFFWSHNEGREQLQLSASQYIHHLLDWVQEQLDDDNIFPSTAPDKAFPENYLDVCKTIFSRLIRVYAHVYHNHLDKVRELKEEAHMNTSLKHFIYFAREFDLLTEQDQEPLKEYIESLT